MRLVYILHIALAASLLLGDKTGVPVNQPVFNVPTRMLVAHNCTITKVDGTVSNIYIEFTGSWKNAREWHLSPEVSKNGLSVNGDSMEALRLVSALKLSAKALLNKRVDIAIECQGLMSRGGIPFVFLPEDKVRITLSSPQ